VRARYERSAQECAATACCASSASASAYHARHVHAAGVRRSAAARARKRKCVFSRGSARCRRCVLSRLMPPLRRLAPSSAFHNVVRQKTPFIQAACSRVQALRQAGAGAAKACDAICERCATRKSVAEQKAHSAARETPTRECIEASNTCHKERMTTHTQNGCMPAAIRRCFEMPTTARR